MADHPAPTAASFGRRIGSLCYEALLVAAILFAAAWIFLAIKPLLPDQIERPLFQLYLAVVCGAYFIYCWTHSGQTLPMKTWRIRVVARYGSTLTPQLALLRYLLALLSAGLIGLGFLWALVDRERQFLHDRLIGSRIIVVENTS